MGNGRWVKAVQNYATAQRTAIHDNLPAVRDGDPDAIHDMRVAARRLRSTLRTFRGLWDRPRSEALRDDLKWLGAQLGKVRDGQVMAAARARPDDRDAALHEARKAYKRGRYAVEVFRPGHKPARKLAKRLGRRQDVLGEHHDTVVLRQLLREEGMRAYGEGENAFTYGLLHARQHESANRLLRKLPKARKAVPRSAKAGWN